MRPKLREQLKRQKARERIRGEFRPFWRAVVPLLRVPWTKGQRKWQDAKLKAMLDAMLAETYANPPPAPDYILASADFRGSPSP